MKRKLDKNKVYAFLGRAVVYSTIYFTAIAGSVWAFCQNTIYQEGTMNNNNENKPNFLEYIAHAVSFFSLGFSTAVLIVKIFII